jgi:coproporphyrinogen III oxidase
MSQTFSYKLYAPSSLVGAVVFPIVFKTLPAPQSQLYQLIQVTKDLQSTTNPETALGLGTSSILKTTVVDQQGQINYTSVISFIMNGEANGETGGDIPPKGVVTFTLSLLNGSTLPSKANDDVRPIVYGPSTSWDCIINTSLCSGAYFGAVGIATITHLSNPYVPYEYTITYTLPPL